jgi:hypothetical protein
MKILYIKKIFTIAIITFNGIKCNDGYLFKNNVLFSPDRSINIDRLQNKLQKCSLLCKNVYDDSLVKNVCDNPLSNNIYDIIYNKENNMKCLIIKDDKNKSIFTIFKGSSYIFDWIYNLDIYPVSIDNNNMYKIHGGIYKLYKSNSFNQNVINSLLKINKYYSYKNYICGHSRGGVLSLLLSFELNKNNKKLDIEVYTFGSPFLLNDHLNNHLMNNLKIKIYSIINDGDIIPQIKMYYARPIGTIINLKNNSILIDNNFDQNYNFNICNVITNIKRFIKNHCISSYCEKLFKKNKLF